ncbi:MAG: hypothetical protein ACQEXE_17660 [Bacillota bacterium]|uniref:hypothetical protein n=1 Tax=Cytobacillus TaxID=2675230 RepID=UPI00077C4AC0|nr:MULTISPECIES: hypothetical protein [Cytobacillus]MBG9543767.1 hypothetical protein [Cytobacillus firmus]MBG9549014.1 hypothetical protein [Cytobacillus firmus]MBG9553104.1 hypothetical protein [Cytobacillus firmus]MBG9555901.1 hypothetical protein [Cytobacillus firmus]MBG9574895.1 hypothetical protein [Cytobacillus firmus]
MKMVWIITGVILIISAVLAVFMYLKSKSSGDPESVINYVQEHRETENMAMVIRHLWPTRQSMWSRLKTYKLPK